MNRLEWLLSKIEGKIGVYSDDDKEFWLKLKETRKDIDISFHPFVEDKDTLVVSEILSHVEDPQKTLNELKGRAKKLLITVPNEYSWDLKYNPFKNPKHKRHYDTESLAQELETAGLTYQLGIVDYDGWSFLVAVAK